MTILTGEEVTVKAGHKTLKAGEKYLVSSVDPLDRLVWLLGHKEPYPLFLFCKVDTKVEETTTIEVLQDILKVLQEIKDKL